MITIKNHKQINFFDPWGHLCPKRRKMIEESLTGLFLSPKEILADSLYESNKNHKKAIQDYLVDLVTPIMCFPKKGSISCSDFKVSETGRINACPKGHYLVGIRKKKHLIRAAFDSEQCRCCPYFSQSQVQTRKNFHYLRYTDKEMIIAQRRTYEGTEEFKECYRLRPGIEGTISRYNRQTSIKHLQIPGLKAERFYVTLKALAINIFRASVYKIILGSEKPNNPRCCSSLFGIFLLLKKLFCNIKQILRIYIPNVMNIIYST